MECFLLFLQSFVDETIVSSEIRAVTSVGHGYHSQGVLVTCQFVRALKPAELRTLEVNQLTP
jgi:hypothetical protein